MVPQPSGLLGFHFVFFSGIGGWVGGVHVGGLVGVPQPGFSCFSGWVAMPTSC